MQTVETIPGRTYAVESAGEVTITNTETGAIAAQGDGSGQVLFTACANSYTVSDDAAKVVALFKLAPRLRLSLLQGGAGGWLPKGFTELEYLEKVNVSSYIQTGVYLSSNTEFECRFSCESWASSAVFGARVYWRENMFELCVDGNSLTMRYGVDDPYLGNNSGLPTWDVKYIGDYITANDANVYINRRSFDIPAPMCIFAVGEPNAVYDKNFTGKLYYLRLNTDGEKHNFIPALDDVGAPCMYDVATRKAYYNSGEGDFGYPTARAAFALRRVLPDWGRLSERGLQRLYHAPKDYKGDIEEFALAHGFKHIVETESPEDGYWTPRWKETDEEIVLEWVETKPPTYFGIKQDELLTE